MSDEAWDYDLTTGHVIADLGFWSTLIEQYRPRRVLEIGCRTGRVSFSVVTKDWQRSPDFI